jgi:hypothetical protein
LLTVSVPPDVSPEKVAVIFRGVQVRSASMIAFFRLRPDTDPVNGAAKLWSNVRLPLAPAINVTFSESAAPNSRLPLFNSANGKPEHRHQERKSGHVGHLRVGLLEFICVVLLCRKPICPHPLRRALLAFAVPSLHF